MPLALALYQTLPKVAGTEMMIASLILGRESLREDADTDRYLLLLSIFIDFGLEKIILNTCPGSNYGMTEECNCSQLKLLWVPQGEGVKGLEIQRRGRRKRVQVKLDRTVGARRDSEGQSPGSRCAGGILRTEIPGIWCLLACWSDPGAQPHSDLQTVGGRDFMVAWVVWEAAGKGGGCWCLGG